MPPNHPLENPAVTRLDDHSVRISWRYSSETVPVDIYAGPTPGRIDFTGPVANTHGGPPVVVDRLRSDRPYYFALVCPGSPELIVGERRMPLEGSVNFRDLGGYPAGGAKTVRWGQIFRSDNLARLTDRDIEMLECLELATVVDFRTEAEIERSPDRLPARDRLRYLHMPIQHGEHDPAAAFERIKKGDHQWLSEDFMAEGYMRSIDDFAPLWARFFNTLASADRRPLVFHCTGGKDRTGTAAALILSVLGVADGIIVHDYALSAGYIAGVLETIYAQLEEMGVDPRGVAPYFTVTPSRMRRLLAHIEKTCGSAADYLVDRAGVDSGVIRRLKSDLLV